MWSIGVVEWWGSGVVGLCCGVQWSGGVVDWWGCGVEVSGVVG